MSVMNLHNLVEVEIDDAIPWCSLLTEAIADTAELNQPTSALPPAKITISFTDDLSLTGMREIEDRVYGRDGVLIDCRYGVSLECPNATTFNITTNNPCLEWFSWTLQMAALSVGRTFVHSAAVEKNGRAIVFPSWGGVGKTALVAGFIKYHGWNLLGDDFSILSCNGACSGYPKPMVVYPFLTLLHFARRHYPQSVTVRASEVFGREKLSAKGRLDTVVWLDRVSGLTEAEIMPDNTLASRILGSTLSQYDQRCISLTNVAMGLGILDSAALYTRWDNILRDALSGVPTFALHIPAELPVGEVPRVVYDMLSRFNVLDRTASQPGKAA